MNLVRESLLDTFKLPSPTLSYSSTRNYKRQEDYPVVDVIKTRRWSLNIDHNDSNYGKNNHHNSIEIEKRLYGNRYKNAYGVYLRLLQVLEKIKSETKDQVSEYVFDQIEQSFSRTASSTPPPPAATTTTLTTTTTTTTTVKLTNTQSSGTKLEPNPNIMMMMEDEQQKLPSNVMVQNSDIDKSIKMNKQNQERMKVIIALALFRRHDANQDAAGSLLTWSSSSSSSQQQVVMEFIDNKYDLKTITVQDLIYILRVRGNVKRRGPIPKSRKKVLEHLSISFSTDLFQP